MKHFRRRLPAFARCLGLGLLSLSVLALGGPTDIARAEDDPPTTYRATVSMIDDLGNLFAGAQTLYTVVDTAIDAFTQKGAVSVEFQTTIPQPFNVDLGMTYQVPFKVNYRWLDSYSPQDSAGFVEIYVVLDNGTIEDENAKVVYVKRIPETGYFEDRLFDHDDTQAGSVLGSVWVGPRSYDPTLKETRVRVVAAMFRVDEKFAYEKHRQPPYREVVPDFTKFRQTAFVVGGVQAYWGLYGQYSDHQYEQMHHYVPGHGLVIPADLRDHCASCTGTNSTARAAAILGGLRVESQDSVELRTIVQNPFYVNQLAPDGRTDNGVTKPLTPATWWYNNFTAYAQYSNSYGAPIQMREPSPPIVSLEVSGLARSAGWSFFPVTPEAFRLAVTAAHVAPDTPARQAVEWRGRWEGPRPASIARSEYTGEWTVTVRVPLLFGARNRVPPTTRPTCSSSTGPPLSGRAPDRKTTGPCPIARPTPMPRNAVSPLLARPLASVPRLATRLIAAVALAFALPLVPAEVTPVDAQTQPPPRFRESATAVFIPPTQIVSSGTVVANSNPELCRDSARRVGGSFNRTLQVETAGETLTIAGAAPMVGSRARSLVGPIDVGGTFDITATSDDGVITRWTGAFGPSGNGFAQATESTPTGSACTVEWQVTFLPTFAGIQGRSEIASWSPVVWPAPAPYCPPDVANGVILATALEDGGRSSGLFRMTANGLCLTRVGTAPSASFFSAISPDGQQALFGAFAAGTETRWQLVDLRDGSVTSLPGNAYSWPVWTPDGTPTTLNIGFRAMGIHPWGNLQSAAAPDWSYVALAWDVYGPSTHSSGILVVDTRTGATIATVGPPPDICAVTPPPATDECRSDSYEPLGFWLDEGLLFYRTGSGGSSLGWSAIEAVRLDGSGEVALSARLEDAPPGSPFEWHLLAALRQSDPPQLVQRPAGLDFLASVPRGAGYDLLAISPTTLAESIPLARAPERLRPIAYYPVRAPVPIEP